MPEQIDTLPTVNPIGFSEWSTENTFDDPLESRLKFGDYLREEYLRAGAYDLVVENEILEGFPRSLYDAGILSPEEDNQ